MKEGKLPEELFKRLEQYKATFFALGLEMTEKQAEVF